MTMKGCQKTTCPYCGVGCGVETDGITVAGDKSHPANAGSLCVKGAALAESLDMPSRLLSPQLAGQQISWSEATGEIAQRIAQAIDQHGPDSVAMYVSGQLLTEDYYVANKLMKGYVGSANIDTNSRLCMSSAVAAHVRAFGEDVVPVSYRDIDQTDLIVICGANTAWTHPVLFKRIQQARENNPQLKLVVIDPRTTVTAQQADLHLDISNDGDVALFNGLIKHCLATDNIDKAYIDAHTSGFEPLRNEVTSPAFTLPSLSDRLGVGQDKLHTFYQWFANSASAMTLFCQGVNQSGNGVDKGNAIINAHLATGKIGKPGSGPFSLTGQPNAMGGREVGGLANQLAVHRGFDQDSVRQVQQFWNSPHIADQPGLKAVELFNAVAQGKIKVLWIMATNPVVSLPDNQHVRQALENCPFVIVSDITAGADVAAYADLLLPAAGWGEKQGTVTNSERRLSHQRQFMPPPGEARPDWWAISQVGSALCRMRNTDNGFAFQTEADIFREYAAMTGINRHSPLLLDLSAYQAISDEDYQNWQPTQWGGAQPFSDGRFSHPDGRARFIATADTQQKPSSRLWWLNTGRQRDQWHTMTRTGHIPHLAATETDPCVYMNPQSATDARFKIGEIVALTQPVTGEHILARVAIDEGLGDRELFMSMHWAGIYGGNSQVNAVVTRQTDPISGQPAFKSSQVEVTAANVVTYGLFVGRGFNPQEFAYASFQTEEQADIWRFAHLEPAEKRHLCRTEWSRRITLDIPGGWLGVDFEIQDRSYIVRSVLICSERPVQSDYSQLTTLIGQPLVFSELLTLTTSQQAAKVVCSCFRVTDQHIIQAIEQDNCVSLEQLQSKLKCGTNCGSCIPQIKQLLTEDSDLAVEVN
jgi:assimilatory nitrate reductase catalytic subunit